MNWDYEAIHIPSAEFMMGSSREEIQKCLQYWSSRLVSSEYTMAVFSTWIEKEFPAHSVSLPSYAIGKYPITNAQYLEFVECEGRSIPESIQSCLPGNHPVWGVSYEDAKDFTRWIAKKTEINYRLPRECEWELAARGASRREYPYGNSFDPKRCNTLESGQGATTAVDAYPLGASEFGLWDMAGNVEEWTADYYLPYPKGTLIEDDLLRSLGQKYHVLRGGSFARGGDLTRCARRHGPFPSPEFRYTGFRLVFSVA